MNFISVLVILSLISTNLSTDAIEIINLENKHHILTRVDDSFLFESEQFLFHIFDLDQLYHQVSRITNLTTYDKILTIKATKYLAQLGYKKIYKRSINILGTGIKWITGNPDHDDLIQLQEKINQLIENNNALRENNKIITKAMSNIGNENMNSQILREVIEDLQNIILTLNMAKNDQINTLALNLAEIKILMKIEGRRLPVINILEYSTIHICKIDNTIILIIKYPVINRQCEHYKITPLEFRHGKIETDKQISKCNDLFQRTKRCAAILNTNICQIEKPDNCTLKILQNQNNAQCIVKQEENEKIQLINSGHIILSGKHQVNNFSVEGVNLVNFEHNVTIDSVLYTNFEKEAKEYMIMHKNEKFEILKVIETDRKNLEFKDIKALRRFTIPFEEHPVETIFIILVIIISCILLIYVLGKCCNIYKTYREAELKKQYLKTLKSEYEKRGLQLSIT